MTYLLLFAACTVGCPLMPTDSASFALCPARTGIGSTALAPLVLLLLKFGEHPYLRLHIKE